MTLDEARKKIIFALDVNGIGEIGRLSGMLSGRVGMFKVGKELFTACGPSSVKAIRKLGIDVFLDLKFHDIPNTVARAVVEAARLGASLVNLHALGGGEMMECAVKAVEKEFGSDRPKLLAVTILTSSTESTLRQVGISEPLEDMVTRLARLARKSGMDGVVASPREIPFIRESCGDDFLVVTPGIRPIFASADDQKRIMTPSEAVRAGADYLVIGRPIAGASDPAVAADMIADEIAGSAP